jgi:hypothetical protein
MVVGTAFLFYAFGWSLNQTSEGAFTFQKTGAVFLRIKPGATTVKINNKIYNPANSFFSNGSSELIKGLLPGDYEVEVFKESFGSWQKKLTVEAGLISSASKIFLFPQEVPIELISKAEAEKFWLTDNKKEQIKGIFNSLKQKELKIPGPVTINQIIASPFDTSQTLITSPTALYLFDQNNFKLELLAPISVQALATNGLEIVLVDQNNNLQFYDLANKKITQKIPLLLKEEIAKIIFSKISTQIGLLTKENRLFIYQRPKQELKVVAEGIKDFRFSPDSKKIAALTLNNEIAIYFLGDYNNDFMMAAGEKFGLNLPQNSQILDFDWIPKILDYLVIRYPDEIIAAEVDKRPPTNWWFLEKNINNFAFDGESNLYFLKDNQFLKVNLEY